METVKLLHSGRLGDRFCRHECRRGQNDRAPAERGCGGGGRRREIEGEIDDRRQIKKKDTRPCSLSPAVTDARTLDLPRAANPVIISHPLSN